MYHLLFSVYLHPRQVAILSNKSSSSRSILLQISHNKHVQHWTTVSSLPTIHIIDQVTLAKYPWQRLVPLPHSSIQSVAKSCQCHHESTPPTAFCSLSSLSWLGTIISQSILKASLLNFLVLSCLSPVFSLQSIQRDFFLSNRNCFMQIPQWLPGALRIKSQILNISYQVPAYLPTSCHTTEARYTGLFPRFLNTQSFFFFFFFFFAWKPLYVLENLHMSLFLECFSFQVLSGLLLLTLPSWL